jgi:hypothetical protein
MSTPPSSVLERIDPICDRYEAAWLAGQRPRIDDYLRQVPEVERAALLHELLRLQRAYLQGDQRRRWQQGERVSVRAYLEETPSLHDYPELVFELVCSEVLLREEMGEKPKPVDYLDLVPSHQTQLRRFFTARDLLPPATLQGMSDPLTERAAKAATVVEAAHTVDELPPSASAHASMPPASERPAPLGEAVLAQPGYEVLGELGHGGMGVVFKARQIKAGHLVALKMILAGRHAEPDQLSRFRTEAEAIARLQHPHVVQVFEVGEHNGLPFFSLELCPGGSLDKKLAGTPVPPREAATLVAKLAQGVQAAHQARVLHRDLKPANVLLAANGTPKVTDFGLAKKLDAQGVTLPGVIMGTPSYMAPEQASGAGAELGPVVDVYALGAILYECLTGRPPFRAATVLDTLRQVVSEEPVPPRQLNAQVPRDLETICLKCLHKEADKRYRSAAELAQDLGRYLGGEPVQARPVRSWERAWKWARRRPALASLAAVIVVATLSLLGGGLWFMAQLTEQRNQAIQARDEVEREKTRTEKQLLRSEWLLYASQIALAQRAWQDGDVQHARDLLDACRWDFRGWEHAYLRHLFDETYQTFRGHTHWVHSVSFSPDGKRLASASLDQTVKVWDAQTGKEVLTLKGHTLWVHSVSFSPDGKHMATASGELGKPGEVKVWDGQTGQEVLTLEGHTEPVLGVVFSPDGKRLASASGDKTVKVWAAHTN